MALLACQDLGREFHGHPALVGLTLSLAPGEGLALVGANGAGKSTALKLAAGVLLPTSGDVAVLGQAPGFTPAVRGRIGFLGHEGFLEPDEPVSRQVAFFHALRGGGEPGPEAVCQAFELEAVWEADAGTLSRGYTRRAELAAVLAGGPALLLLDEPLGGLDQAQRDALPGVLRGLVPEAGILVATHSLGALQALCPTRIEILAGVPSSRLPSETAAP